MPVSLEHLISSDLSLIDILIQWFNRTVGNRISFLMSSFSAKIDRS